MSCNQGNFPNNPNCFEVSQTKCIYYDGPTLCVDLPVLAYLNDVLKAIADAYCAGGSKFDSKDYACLSSYTITSQQTLFEAVSDIICKILGTQTPGAVTSISELRGLINTLNTNIDALNSQTVQACFKEISVDPLNNTEDIGVIITALQKSICSLYDLLNALGDEYVKVSSTDTQTGYLIDKLVPGTNVSFTIIDWGENEVLKIVVPDTTPAVVNVQDTPTVDLTNSSSTISADIKVSAAPLNTLVKLPDGLFVSVESILSVIINNPTYSHLFCNICPTTTTSTTSTTSTSTTTTTAAPTTTTTSTSTSSTTLAPTTTTTTSTTTTTILENIRVTNTLFGQSITAVTGVPGYVLSGPVNTGGLDSGNHTAFTGTVSVTVSGNAFLAGNLHIYINGVAQFPCYNIPTGSFTSTKTWTITASATDIIDVSLSSGAC